MSNPQETCVITQDTFRIMDREAPTSSSVTALVSRLQTVSVAEGTNVKEKVDGTTEEDGKNDYTIFPWLSKINDLCRSAVGSKNISSLENLLTVYLQKVTSSVVDSYLKPFRANKLKTCMSKSFVYFHFLYQDIKEFVDGTTYLQKMTELMAMYLDLEIKSSHRRKETSKKVASRMASALNIYLDYSEDHILDALMRTKTIKTTEKEIWCPILEKLLTTFQKRQMQDTLYVRYLLVFKLWKKVANDMAMRKKINLLAIDKLPAPTNFTDRYKRFNNVLPRVPTNKDITTFYMQAKIDVIKACQNFMKISKDPTLPTIPDKTIFFGGRSQLPLSGKGNYDGGVSRNLMKEIWSSEESTSIINKKKSNNNKKKGKNKKADAKKEKSVSISETESTPEVPVKTEPWGELVDIRADVVMINSSQPPPPGTEPPPLTRIPPPPPPPQTKPLLPPMLPKPLEPAPALKIQVKPIATIVAMKKEVTPLHFPLACMKTDIVVPEINFKVECKDCKEKTAALSPEPSKPHYEESMEVEAPVQHFEPASEMEQVFEECEIQLGDQDLPYIEEEVVEPCNPVGYADSPEADFEKAAVEDLCSASQSMRAVDPETLPDEVRKRPEKTQSPAVVGQGIKLRTDIHIVPLQKIKSERLDSPEHEPAPFCVEAERVKCERMAASKLNGVVQAQELASKLKGVTVTPAEQRVVSRENHSGSHSADSLTRKNRTLTSEGHRSPSKSQSSYSDANTLSNKVRNSSSEGHVSLPKVRTSTSEGPSSSPKYRSSSNESNTSSPRSRNSSSEGRISSPKVHHLSKESLSATVRVVAGPRALGLYGGSSEGQKVRTSSSERNTSSPKTRISTSDSHTSMSKLQTVSSGNQAQAPNVKASLSESHTSSPKRGSSTSENRASPKIRTSSSEGQKIPSSSSEGHKSRTSSSESRVLTPKIRTSSTDGRTLSPTVQTTSSEGHRIRSSSSVHTSTKHEKPLPPASSPQLWATTLGNMPTLQAEHPVQNKAERPHHLNGTKLHQDIGFYQSNSTNGEYVQFFAPQKTMDLADLEVAMAPTSDRVWLEAGEKQDEKDAALKLKMPPPISLSPHADKARSPRSRSPRTPSPRTELGFVAHRTEQPAMARTEPQPPAPFSAFVTPKPPSPQKSVPFGLLNSPAVTADSLFAAPRAYEPEPECQISLSQDDILLPQALPTLDLLNCGDFGDFYSENYPFGDDAYFGGFPFNEDYMFNSIELNHTCMVDPNVLEQRPTSTNHESFAFSSYAVDPVARSSSTFPVSQSHWQNSAIDSMQNADLTSILSGDDDSNGYSPYMKTTAGSYPDSYAANEYLNPIGMLDPSVPVAPERVTKTPDARMPHEDTKATTATTELRKRHHPSSRPHLQDNSSVINCLPLGVSKPTVPTVARTGMLPPPMVSNPNPSPQPGKACCKACRSQLLWMRYNAWQQQRMACNAPRYHPAYQGKPPVREPAVPDMPLRPVAPPERVKTDTEKNEEIRQMVRDYERQQASESRSVETADSESKDSVESEARTKAEHLSLPPKKRHKAMSMERPAISESFPSYPTRPMMSIAELEGERVTIVAKDDRLENAKKREEIIARYKKPEKVEFDKLKPLPPIIRSVNGRPGQPSRSYPAPTRATSGSVNFAEQSAGRSFKTPAQLKEHTFSNRDNVYYRCGPYIGEYGQIIYPQNPNESESQKGSMILKRLSYVEQPKPILDLSVPIDCVSKEQKETASRKKSKEKSNASTRASKRKSQSKKSTSEADSKRRR